MTKVISEQTQPELNSELIETQEQFIKRALEARDNAKITGIYYSSDEVFAKLTRMIELAKSKKSSCDSQ